MMIDRAAPSDRDAFAAMLIQDARHFDTGESGQVEVGDPADGDRPLVTIRRQREDPPGAVTLALTIEVDPNAWLAVSAAVAEYAGDEAPVRTARQITPVRKSSGGEFFVETHVGRLVAAGEYTEYFWTLACAQLGLDG